MLDSLRHQLSRMPPLALRFRIGLGVGLIVLSVLIYLLLYFTRPTVEAVAPGERRQTVLVYEARPTPVQRQWIGYGTAEALNEADVPARVTATVEAVPEGSAPGQAVEAGQVLLRLDDSDFERELEMARQQIVELEAAIAELEVREGFFEQRLELAQSDVATAQAEFDRLQDLVARGAANAQDVDNSQRTLVAAKRSRLAARESLALLPTQRQSLQARLAAQRAAAELAKLNLQRCSIESPIDGIIQALDAEPGESVSSGQVVARVVAPAPVEVPIALPAAARWSVSVGDVVQLRTTSAAADRGRWSTRLARLAPVLDVASRTITAYAILGEGSKGDGSGTAPRPGAFLEARVLAGQPTRRTIVPRGAIRAGRIQVVRDGMVSSLPIEVDYTLTGAQPQTGLPDRQWAVLDEALPPGALVLINASSLLHDGQRVTPRPGKQPPRKQAPATRPATQPAEAPS